METTIEGATGIILNIKGGMDLTLDEVYEAADLVKEVVDPTCNIIFGSGIDENMSDEVEITVIATGFNNSYSEESRPEPKDLIQQDEKDEEPSEEQQEEDEEAEESSIETLDDSDIPPFIRNRLKNKRR